MALDSVTLLKQSIANVDAQLADLTAGVNPDYSLDGESVQLAAYRTQLLKDRADLVKALIQAEGHEDVFTVGMP